MTNLPGLRAERLETIARDRHQLRHSLQIPIGIADVDMSHIGRERHHGVAEVGAIPPATASGGGR